MASTKSGISYAGSSSQGDGSPVAGYFSPVPGHYDIVVSSSTPGLGATESGCEIIDDGIKGSYRPHIDPLGPRNPYLHDVIIVVSSRLLGNCGRCLF
jgi:hypothetical protein